MSCLMAGHFSMLKKHIVQTDIYMRYKGKKALPDSKQILFTAAHNYLEDVMDARPPTDKTKAWKTEYAKLTNQRNGLNQRYVALKDEVKEAEQIRKSVYSILRQEQRKRQPHRAHDMEH